MAVEIDWRPTLISIGFPEEFLSGRNSACPLCNAGKDRYRFTDHMGKGTFICNQCCPESGNGFELVKRYFGLTFEEALNKVNQNRIVSHGNIASMRRESQYETNKIKFSMMYKTLMPAANTPAHKYLNRRGIAMPDMYTRFVKDRNIQMGCFWMPEFEDGFGAMTWLAIELPTNTLSQMHMTKLTQDGFKPDVKTVKKYSSAISKLEPEHYRVAPLLYGDPETIIVAEGIETALSCLEIFRKLEPQGTILPTVYASMDAGMLAKFRPFEGDFSRQKYIVCGDRDESNTGQRAAASAAMNIKHATGRDDSVMVVLPDEVGVDWNDVLLSGDERSMMAIIKPQ